MGSDGATVVAGSLLTTAGTLFVSTDVDRVAGGDARSTESIHVRRHYRQQSPS
jgi:hypothetical protein